MKKPDEEPDEEGGWPPKGWTSRRSSASCWRIDLKVPKVTAATCFPSLFEPLRRAEKALYAVICEAYVKGVSTRKVDDLVRALGMDGISKARSRGSARPWDEDVMTFLARSIDGAYPYMRLGATFHTIRLAGG